ncbi:MAG: phytoene desaturase family protein [Candidatus Saccharimonadaceae bacterium]
MTKVIIIGAGIGGLATANLFARDGHEVHVYEKNDQLGGRAGQFEKDGFTFDTGPSWYLMPEVFEHYYQLFNTSAQKELDLIKLTPAYKIYSGDQPITITGDLTKDTRTFEAIEAGSGEKLKKYIAKSVQTYRLSLKHFLYSNFDSPWALAHGEILKHGLAMLQLATMPIHSYVKKQFKNPRLQQVLEYPTVFLGSSPYSAPALYSLMSALDFDDGVYYPKGTMYAVVQSLVRIGDSLNVQYHLNSPVVKIITKENKAVGIKLKNAVIEHADVTISNADLHFTETKLLAPNKQSYPEAYWKKREASPSALLMYLGIKGKIPEFEHHTLLFTENWQENFDAIFNKKAIPAPASLYISKTSQSDTTAPKGHENIFVLVPLPSGISLTNRETDELADTYLAQIKTTTGVDLKAHTVSRTLFGPNDFAGKYNAWQSTMLGPSHKLSQSAFFRTPNKSKKVAGLFYVGASTVPGVGVPMCLIGAELVYKRILKEGKL